MLLHTIHHVHLCTRQLVRNVLEYATRVMKYTCINYRVPTYYDPFGVSCDIPTLSYFITNRRVFYTVVCIDTYNNITMHDNFSFRPLFLIPLFSFSVSTYLQRSHAISDGPAAAAAPVSQHMCLV